MALLENVIGFGTHADRPAAGAPGALYGENDTGFVYRDNGTTWDLIAALGQPALTIVHMSDDLTLSVANCFVACTDAAQAAGKTLTLPPAVDWPGQLIHTMAPNGNSPHTVAQGGDTIVGATCTVQLISDGVDKWYGIDC